MKKGAIFNKTEHDFWKQSLYWCGAGEVLKSLCCVVPGGFISFPGTELGPEGPNPEADLEPGVQVQ